MNIGKTMMNLTDREWADVALGIKIQGQLGNLKSEVVGYLGDVLIEFHEGDTDEACDMLVNQPKDSNDYKAAFLQIIKEEAPDALAE